MLTSSHVGRRMGYMKQLIISFNPKHIMKNIKFSFLALTLVVLSLTACTEDILNVDFMLKFNSVDFVIQPQDQVENGEITMTIVTSTLKDELNANDATIDKLKSVNIEYVSLQILSPGVTFDLIENASLHIRAQGQEEVMIAELAKIPAGATQIEMPVKGEEELKEYLKQDQFDVVVRGTTTGPLEKAVEMRAKMDFEVTAGL
ncbi:MAG: hypothetical protein AAGI38_07785 [Bacteroidota bacterium]